MLSLSTPKGTIGAAIPMPNILTTKANFIFAEMEIPKEKLLTLIRRKKAGLPLEDTEYQPLIERGSR